VGGGDGAAVARGAGGADRAGRQAAAAARRAAAAARGNAATRAAGGGGGGAAGGPAAPAGGGGRPPLLLPAAAAPPNADDEPPALEAVPSAPPAPPTATPVAGPVPTAVAAAEWGAIEPPAHSPLRAVLGSLPAAPTMPAPALAAPAPWQLAIAPPPAAGHAQHMTTYGAVAALLVGAGYLGALVARRLRHRAAPRSVAELERLLRAKAADFKPALSAFLTDDDPERADAHVCALVKWVGRAKARTVIRWALGPTDASVAEAAFGACNEASPVTQSAQRISDEALALLVQQLRPPR
jgi:hypothetical protein